MILGYPQETSIPSVSPVLPSRFHAHGVKSQDFPKPTTLSRHLPRNRTFRTWTCGIIAAESDRLVFFKGTISGSMCFCIAFYDTEKILETMLFCCLAMRWSTFGPIVRQSKKKHINVGSCWLDYISHHIKFWWKWMEIRLTQCHKSPIVDGLCLCISGKLGSQWGWFLALDLPLSTHILIVSWNNCLSSLQHPILSLVPCRHAPRKV